MVSNIYLFHGQCKKYNTILCCLLNVVDKYDLLKSGFVFRVYTNGQLGIHGLYFSECKALFKPNLLNCTTTGFSIRSSLQLVLISFFILHELGSMTIHTYSFLSSVSLVVLNSTISFTTLYCFNSPVNMLCNSLR